MTQRDGCKARSRAGSGWRVGLSRPVFPAGMGSRGRPGSHALGPCGKDRQILFDYHPRIRVILPTPDGIRSVKITDLMPLGAVWTPEEGTRAFDPGLFGE